MKRTSQRITLAAAVCLGAASTWWLAAGAQAQGRGCTVCGGSLPCVPGHTPISFRDRGPAPCVLDGVCVPNSATWGHYPTRWRRWPVAQEATPDIVVDDADLPPYVRPTPPQEDQRSPAPFGPPQQQPRPQQPRPMAPGPGVGGGLGPAPAPMPVAPLVPNGNNLDIRPPAVAPQGVAPPAFAPPAVTPPSVTPPSVNPFAPPPSNPFQGSQVEPQEEVIPAVHEENDDPPPTLPLHLQVAERERAGEIAQAMRAMRAAVVSNAPVERLPSIRDGEGSFPVMQASATVFASGDSIGEFEWTDEGVRQAIHFEPIEDAE